MKKLLLSTFVAMFAMTAVYAQDDATAGGEAQGNIYLAVPGFDESQRAFGTAQPMQDYIDMYIAIGYGDYAGNVTADLACAKFTTDVLKEYAGRNIVGLSFIGFVSDREVSGKLIVGGTEKSTGWVPETIAEGTTTSAITADSTFNLYMWNDIMFAETYTIPTDETELKDIYAGYSINAKTPKYVGGGTAGEDADGIYFVYFNQGSAGTLFRSVNEILEEGASDAPYKPMVAVKLIIANEAAGVESVSADGNNSVKGYYTTGGCKVSAPVKGINIVRMADGKTRKVVVNK